jgi:hypothetical protein
LLFIESTASQLLLLAREYPPTATTVSVISPLGAFRRKTLNENGNGNLIEIATMEITCRIAGYRTVGQRTVHIRSRKELLENLYISNPFTTFVSSILIMKRRK